MTTKNMVVDYLYLDKVHCNRCLETEQQLMQSLNNLSFILKPNGYQIQVNRIKMDHQELALKYQFERSPYHSGKSDRYWVQPGGK